MSEINRPWSSNVRLNFECQKFGWATNDRNAEVQMSEKYFECQICFSGRTSILTLSTCTSASHTASPQICHGSSPSQGNDTHTSRDTIMSEIMCHTIYFKWQKYVWSLVRMSDLQSDTPSMYTSHGVSYCVCHDRIVPITSNVRFIMLSKFECQIFIFAVST